jgi:hypothetical protein
MFSGDATGNTLPFRVGSEWRVVWRSTPGTIGAANFAISVMQPGNSAELGLVGNVVGAGHATSYQYAAGTFYLSVQANEKYTVKVQTAGRVPRQPFHRWKVVTVFKGAAQEQTRPFRVKSPWRIVWRSYPGSIGPANFAAYVEQPGAVAPMGLFANVIGRDSGVDYEYARGTFYLNFNADERYIATVEQGS